MEVVTAQIALFSSKQVQTSTRCMKKGYKETRSRPFPVSFGSAKPGLGTMGNTLMKGQSHFSFLPVPLAHLYIWNQRSKERKRKHR